MRAILIEPEQQSIQMIEINDLADIVKLIGFDTVVSDKFTSNDHLFFDEECFLRGTQGRFQLDKMIPIAGRAVLVGIGADGESLSDISSTLEDVQKLIKYL